MSIVNIMEELRKELDAMKKANQKLVKEVNLSKDEMLDMIEIYTDWESLPNGFNLSSGEYYKYKGSLYQVVNGKDHKKLDNRTPTVQSLFTKVVPDEVIPRWEQRYSHNSYPLGQKVTASDGKTYELIDVGWQAYEPPNAGWKET